MSERTRIQLYLYPEFPIDVGALIQSAVKEFEANPRFAPTSWGTNERTRAPYSSEQVVASAESRGIAYLYRDKAVKYAGYFDLGKFPFFSFEFHKSMGESHWPELLKLADGIVRLARARFAVVHIFHTPLMSWVTDEDRMLQWMTFSAQPIPVRFRTNGPLGLGMRTYFGGDVLDMFGRDLLMSTPASVAALDWGGIRIDLGEDMWNMEQVEVLSRWQAAMHHLSSARAMAEPIFENDHRTVGFRPSPGWLARKERRESARNQ